MINLEELTEDGKKFVLANRRRSREYYQKRKDDPEYKAKVREYQRKRYKLMTGKIKAQE